MSLSPRTTALVLLDLQIHNLDQIGDKSEEIKKNAISLLSACRERGMTIAHVRVGLEEQEYQDISPNNKGWSYLRAKGSAKDAGVETSLPHLQFHPDVAPISGELVIRKTRVGAFSTTNLHQLLQQQDISHLIIAGIATSGAVLSTVRDAADKDYGMTIASDACADRKEAVHSFLLEHILSKNCDVQTTEEIVGKSAVS